MANNYDDEIDLYGDAAVDMKGGSPNNQTNVSGFGDAGGSSIPTFISEARGGTGIIPPREESPDQLPGLEGVIPKNGDYGAPGQWKTKPVSTVRPSDMPEEGQVTLPLLVLFHSTDPYRTTARRRFMAFMHTLQREFQL